MSQSFKLMALLFGALLFAGAVSAAEEKAATDKTSAKTTTAATAKATAPKAAEATQPATADAPKPADSDAAASTEVTPKDSLTVYDASTLRPSSDHEVLIMDLVYRCNEAIRNNNLPEADAQIKIMTQFLPKDSLTLLRMRAWYALAAKQDDEARLLYRQILARVADDENAGINLAILEARAGHVDEAKRILNDLANRNPDSERLTTVRQAFGLIRQK